ncbi:DUF2269 family protein [Myxococcota bacterium]|nr:DUF2269 family protein [Myxococcota bacterium]
MSLDSLVVFVHVVAGVALVGHSLSSLYLRAAIGSAESTSALRLWLSLARRSSRLNPIAAMVLLATGLYLGSKGWWTHPWFFASLALFVVSSAYGARTIGAGAGALEEAVGSQPDGAVPPRIDALRRRTSWLVAFDLMVAGDLAAIFLMTNKPGLVGTVGALAVACGVALGIGAALRRGSHAADPHAVPAVGAR